MDGWMDLDAGKIWYEMVASSATYSYIVNSVKSSPTWLKEGLKCCRIASGSSLCTSLTIVTVTLLYWHTSSKYTIIDKMHPGTLLKPTLLSVRSYTLGTCCCFYPLICFLPMAIFLILNRFFQLYPVCSMQRISLQSLYCICPAIFQRLTVPEKVSLST